MQVNERKYGTTRWKHFWFKLVETTHFPEAVCKQPPKVTKGEANVVFEEKGRPQPHPWCVKRRR